MTRILPVVRRHGRTLAGYMVGAAVVVGVTLAVLNQPEPGRVTVALAAGALGGLLAGAYWRRELREERDEARALVDAWNSSEAREALAEVGSIAPERRAAVELYDQDAVAGVGTYPRRLS